MIAMMSFICAPCPGFVPGVGRRLRGGLPAKRALERSTLSYYLAVRALRSSSRNIFFVHSIERNFMALRRLLVTHFMPRRIIEKVSGPEGATCTSWNSNRLMAT